MKCLKTKEKTKKIIFFSLFSVPNVSVVYTFETFNVYVFYTSTDIFLVLFYKWQEFKSGKKKFEKEQCGSPKFVNLWTVTKVELKKKALME